MGIIGDIEALFEPQNTSSLPVVPVADPTVPALAAAAVMPAPAPAALPGKPIITVAILTALGGHEAADWAPILDAACRSHGIDTPLRVSAWLANVLNETGSLTVLSENLNYSAESLVAQWPSHFTEATAQEYGRTATHAANQEAIANLAYGGRGGNCKAGDGWLFRGAGGMQTTFRGNFAALAPVIGWTRPLEELPAYLQTREGAAVSAAVFWQAHTGCNQAADRRDIAAVRKIVNGGEIGLAPVQVHYAACLRAFGIH